ncbi:MAG: mechanosensitive ion channel family protein [Azospirillaceae bacterium]|nr:mechanosensitive ion channel family protein [Azospirillaceae bacterium]
MLTMLLEINPLLVATAVILVGFTANRWAFHLRGGARVAFITIVFILFTLAFARRIGSPFHPDLAGLEHLGTLWARALECVWWLAAAWLAVAWLGLVVAFENYPRESKILSDLIAGVVYVGAILAITTDVFDMPVNGLLATSGVVAIVLGLALQSSLSDVFSGLSINLERPYGIGDFITLEGNIEGKVVEMNWRATRIRTACNDIAVVPNSVIAKSRIINASRPQTSRNVTQTITLDSRTAPERAMAVLRAATLTCRTIVRKPVPSVTCTALRGDGIDYAITFSVDDLTGVDRARTDLLLQIHRHIVWAGIELAGCLPGSVPRSVAPLAPDVVAPAVPAAQRLVERISLFKMLSDEDRLRMAAKLKQRDVAKGKSIVERGQDNGSLFFVLSGVLDIVTRDAFGAERSEGCLGPGDYFDESAFLNGDPSAVAITAVTDAVVFALNKADAASLQSQPTIATQLESSAAHYRVAPADHDAAVTGKPAAGRSSALLSRVAALFRGWSASPNH